MGTKSSIRCKCPFLPIYPSLIPYQVLQTLTPSPPPSFPPSLPPSLACRSLRYGSIAQLLLLGVPARHFQVEQKEAEVKLVDLEEEEEEEGQRTRTTAGI